MSQMRRPVHIPQGNTFIMLQCIKIRKVGDMRQMDHCHIESLLHLGPHQTVRQTVLVIQVDLFHRDHTNDRNVKFFLDHAKSRLQNLHIAPEFIDHQTFDTRPLLRLQKTYRSIKRGKHAAPVNIPDQKHWRIGNLCHSHVYDIIVPQVNLRRTSGAF